MICCIDSIITHGMVEHYNLNESMNKQGDLGILTSLGVIFGILAIFLLSVEISKRGK